MPKVIIITTCLINHADDRGGVTYEQGEIVDVSKETAKTLTVNDRSLYVEKTDDHDKNGLYTATTQLLDAAKKMNKPQKETTAEKKAREAAEAAASADGDANNTVSGDEGSGD